jgi:hypothetical protein
MKKLDVAVDSIANAFGREETYSEIKEVKVDSRMRTLSFHHDHRPAYV